MNLQRLTFVLGGASSGKSAYAESLVFASKRPRVYLATAQAFDAEMTEKIRLHQEMRGADWTTVEAPIDIATVIDGRTKDEVLLIDCLTLWLTNILIADGDVDVEFEKVAKSLLHCACPVIAVSNEVGQGIVPDNALSRKFRSAQGRLNQLVAAHADVAIGVMAGLPFALKGPLPE